MLDVVETFPETSPDMFLKRLQINKVICLQKYGKYKCWGSAFIYFAPHGMITLVFFVDFIAFVSEVICIFAVILVMYETFPEKSLQSDDEVDSINTLKSYAEMKKLHLFSMVCVFALVMATLAGCGKDENGTNNGGSGGTTPEGYVDLGLPSGTKWKADNETSGSANVFYAYDEAFSAFGDKLPSKGQFEELMASCSWEWQSNGGYKVTGPNGKYIVLPAEGYRYCSSDVDGVGTHGCYWSSTADGSGLAWSLGFSSSSKDMNISNLCDDFSVRLVQK